MKNKMKNLLLSVMLIAAMAFTMAGCGSKDQAAEGSSVISEAESQVTVLGEGSTKILFTVVDKEGNETGFEVHTDKETVGEALLEHDLIAGEEGAYGLYVKEVNGITADYDTDGTYWAFYVNGEYAATGVDTTPVTEGEAYAFKVEK